jgi:hypothetical protein
VPASYSTIQKAIDAATATDRVLVAPGTYREAIDFKGKAITVISSSGALKTTIDATGIKNVAAVRFGSGETRNSVLDGFTLTGGSGYLVSSGTEHAGGGIYVTGSATSPTILNNIMRNNDLSVTRSKGAAICIFSGGTPLIRHNLMIGNKATFGGAVYNTGTGSRPTLDRNTIVGNSGDAGAVYGCTRSATTITNSILWGNGSNPIKIGLCKGPPLMTVRYCDVEGGASGIGNIALDPQFVNAGAGDYQLRLTSPCVDSGDPASGKDPDGTRADMGAYYRHHKPGSYKSFGVGCAGTATPPSLKAPNPPTLGTSFTLEIGNLKPLTAGIIVLGNTDKTWNGVPLPLDLKFLGMPGCNLLVNWLVEINIFARNGGTEILKVTIPNDPKLLNVEFYNQAWVLDSAANSLGIATSNGGKGIIGK